MIEVEHGRIVSPFTPQIRRAGNISRQ